MQESKQTFRIVITGNIGSGKSLFCRYLEELGHEIFYADKIAHEVFERNSALWQKRWGSAILTEDKVDRTKVADIVFKDEHELSFLNANTHPQTLEKMDELSKNAKQDYIIFEIPLLFEAKITHLFDYIVLVTADRERVLERLTLRNPKDAENMKLRLSAQMPDVQKITKSHYIVYNNSTKKELKARARDFAELLPTIIV